MARVEIEERQLGANRWAVLILRDDRLLRRTLWDSYRTQDEAQEGAMRARAYLVEKGEAAP